MQDPDSDQQDTLDRRPTATWRAATPGAIKADTMTREDLAEHPSLRVQSDVPADRLCLRCQTTFWSEGFGERVCRRCKASATWKGSLPPSAGHARKR